MPKFRWGGQYSVFVPEIDEDHQRIFNLCRDLQRVVGEDAPDAEIDSRLNELAIHTLEHFWHEERRMRSTGYMFYTWHKQQHHTARAMMKFFEGRIRRGDHEAVRELLAFLHGWLDDHIRLTDRMLGAHLRNHERALCARVS